MNSVLIILAIVLAVYLGYKTKINTGFFCIAFAYIIGCFLVGLKTKELIAMWPTSTMFVILSVSLFYNFAAINGTLEKLSGNLLYACRSFPGLLPFALFFVAVILSVMGAAYFTVLAFLAPITMAICEESKMDKLTGAVAINCGALAGGNFPTAALGVVFRGLMDTAYEATPELALADTFGPEMKVFGFAILFSLVLIAIFRYGFKANREIGKGVTFKKPEAYDAKQKTTLRLIINWPSPESRSPEGHYRKGSLEHHPHDCRRGHAHRRRRQGRHHRGPLSLDRQQRPDLPSTDCLQLHRRLHELLQLHHRRCLPGALPADPRHRRGHRPEPDCALRLHHPRRAEQCDQPLLLRRQPDPRLLR